MARAQTDYYVRLGATFATDLVTDNMGDIVVNAMHVGAGAEAALRARPLKPYLRIAAFPVGALLRIHVRRLFQEANGLASFECRIEDERGVIGSGNLAVFQSTEPAEFSEQVSA